MTVSLTLLKDRSLNSNSDSAKFDFEMMDEFEDEDDQTMEHYLHNKLQQDKLNDIITNIHSPTLKCHADSSKLHIDTTSANN